MAYFRKKPVVIEARQVVAHGDDEPITAYVDRCIALASWCHGKSYMMHSNEKSRYYDGDPGYDHILIHTLEGYMRASVGDWIIKGVSGEFYPCKPDIFVKTYEPSGAPPV